MPLGHNILLDKDPAVSLKDRFSVLFTIASEGFQTINTSRPGPAHNGHEFLSIVERDEVQCGDSWHAGLSF